MTCPQIQFIEHMIFALKSGSSVRLALEQFKKQPLWQKLHLSKAKSIPLTSIEYELQMTLERGLKGLPVLKNLEELYEKAFETLHYQIESQTKKAPFLALIPLFVFQFPALALVFFYPLIHSFLEEIQL